MNILELKLTILSILGIAGSFIASALGGWDTGIETLVLFMAIDYFTGLLVAGVFKKSSKTKSGKIASSVIFVGLAKKAFIIVIVFVAYRMDLTLGSSVVRNAVIIAYIILEAISITENVGLMGVPIPKAIKKALDALSERSEIDEPIQ